MGYLTQRKRRKARLDKYFHLFAYSCSPICSLTLLPGRIFEQILFKYTLWCMKKEMTGKNLYGFAKDKSEQLD